MTELLLKVCGVQREDAARVSGSEFVLRNSQWLPWVITVGLLLVGLVTFSYWRHSRELIGSRKRSLLIGLLLLVLLRPVVAFTLESSILRSLLMLFDTSGSMKIQDPRVDPK